MAKISNLSLSEIYQKLHHFVGKSNPEVDTSTLHGKIVCGYQGWFKFFFWERRGF
jgi:hypothetical protein